MLTLTMPQSEPASDRNRSASRTSAVKIDDDSPCGTALWTSTASSRSVYVMTYRTGAKVSSVTTCGLRRHPDQRGADVGRALGAVDGDGLAADEDLAAVLDGPGQRALHGLGGSPR